MQYLSMCIPQMLMKLNTLCIEFSKYLNDFSKLLFHNEQLQNQTLVVAIDEYNVVHVIIHVRITVPI